MSYKPIVLWRPTATLASDDACTTILQYNLPQAPCTIRPPYQSPHDPAVKLLYVPPLTYFCIKALAEYPDEIHALGPGRLRYERPHSHSDFDILAALIPTYRPFTPDADSFDLSLVDPRLWAVLVQVYENLPSVFRQYTLPLSDQHLPLLQTIPSTQHFSLITVLSLRSCRVLTDDNVKELRYLHTLAALDASVTGLGTWGIRRLAKTLEWSEADDWRPAHRRGPWGLRILRLMDCINVDDNVMHWLSRFPLLSVVDLRGTTCKPWRHPDFPFRRCSDRLLYHPTGLCEALDHLVVAVRQKTGLFSHPAPYTLNVDSLHHRAPPERRFGYALNHLYDRKQNDEKMFGGESPGPARGGRKDVFRPYDPPSVLRKEVPLGSASRNHHIPLAQPHLVTQSNAAVGISTHHSTDDEDDMDEEIDFGTNRILATQPQDQPLVPEDWRQHGFGEGLCRRSPGPEPDPNDDSQWWLMDATEEERRTYFKELEAAEFYTERQQRRRLAVPKPSSVVDARNPHAPAVPAGQKDADPLMLYRAPPPWSVLPTSPAAKSAPRTGRAQSTAFYLADADPALLFPDEVASAGVTPQPSRPTPAPVSSNSRRGLPDSVFDTYSQPASTPAARAPPAVGKPQHAVGDAAPADQARRSMLALSSIQSMIKIVQKRANESSKKDGTPNAGGKGGIPVVPGRANPFARRASGSGVQATIPAKRKAAEVRDEASSTAAGSKTPATAALPSSSKQIPQSDRAARAAPAATAGPSRHSAEQPQSDAKVAMDGSPLPSKKLRPITSLTVPEWPSAHHKPLSHHKPKPLPAVLAKQTTLQVARRPDQPGDELQGKRKAFTPVLKTPKLEMTDIDKSAKAKRTTTKSREKVAKKGGNFDWKEWERR